MALEIPRSRLNVRQIQIAKRNVPLEQIIAVQGQSPVATGIETSGNVIGQALTRRAELQRQGQQLAQLESLAGQQPGAFQGLDPSTAASLTGKMLPDRSAATTTYSPAQLKAIYSGDPSLIASVFPVGVPKEAASLAATSSSRDANREALKEERDRRDEDRKAAMRRGLVDRFNADPAVKKAQLGIEGASNVRALVDSNNPIAAGAIPTYMARASGEVGNLSEADKAPFGGSRAIFSRFQAALKQQANGSLTEENARFLIDLANTMESSASRNIENLARTRAKQYSADGFMAEQSILDSLSPGSKVLRKIESKSTSEQRKATHRWNPATGKVEAIH